MNLRIFLKALLTVSILAATAEWTRALAPTVSSGPFCGVYSLYTALRSQGINLEFSQLIRPDYVSSSSGSTFAGLLKAAQDHQAHGELLENLSVADLHHLNCPAILHVKNEYGAPDFNHFVLCVPVSGGKLAIYDPPAALVRSAGHELAPIWDGTALVASAQPIDLASMRRWAAARIALVVVVTLAAVGVPLFIRMRNRSNPRGSCASLQPLNQCGLLIALAALIAAGYHLLAPEGFMAQRQAVAAINASTAPDSTHSVGLLQARQLWEHGTLFIDARQGEDYEQDHIAGAINIPPDASRMDRAVALAGRPKDAALVVYCQSPSCPYARLLARRLSRDGFDNVHVFAGGWTQWQWPTASDDHLFPLTLSTGVGL